jgi:putative endonuclease
MLSQSVIIKFGLLSNLSLSVCCQLIRVRSVVQLYPGPPNQTAMPFHMYIFRSVSPRQYYVGHTENLRKRLQEHDNGRSRSTKGRGPWELFHAEEFSTRSAASRREREIKRMKSRAQIEEVARASRQGREGRWFNSTPPHQ